MHLRLSIRNRRKFYSLRVNTYGSLLLRISCIDYREIEHGVKAKNIYQSYSHISDMPKEDVSQRNYPDRSRVSAL